MWTLGAVIAVLFLYIFSIYNDLSAGKRQINAVRKIIDTEKQLKIIDIQKLNDSINFHNNMANKFNKQLELFPTNIVAKLFKFSAKKII